MRVGDSNAPLNPQSPTESPTANPTATPTQVKKARQWTRSLSLLSHTHPLGNRADVLRLYISFKVAHGKADSETDLNSNEGGYMAVGTLPTA